MSHCTVRLQILFPPYEKKKNGLHSECAGAHKAIRVIGRSLELFYFEPLDVTHNRRKRTARRCYESLP